MRIRLFVGLGVLALGVGCAEGETLTGGGSSGDGAGPQGGSSGDGSTSATATATAQSSTSSATSTTSTATSTGSGGGAECGNGALEGGEECDGAALGGAMCTTIGQGFTGGTLGCAADCTFDTTTCTSPPDCGNGAIDPAEDCDGTLLGGGTCQTEGFTGGTLSCGGGCLYNTAQCYTCGDGVIAGAEACDGANLGGATCVSLGHDGGTLSCAANCLSFNEIPCSDCGDGLLEAGETCDSGNLGGQTCQSQGFSGGTLACNATCNGFNTSACTSGCTIVNILTNGGFDNGPFGGGWTETSTNFGTPVCSTAACGMGGGTGPHQGTYWAWFGGTNTAFESASVSRSIVIPVGTATLSFQFDLPACEDPFWASDVFSVTIDGALLFQRTNSSAECGAVGWQQFSFDVSAYANGLSHTIQFQGTTDDYFAVTNFMLDSVELMACQ